ncbi:MAG: dephospho-CoA kinase [Gallionella sp.]|jgi:dephospho-CoA kinase|nr:dephospho-CoA kinase [Gallionella sp.]
MSLVVGLTGGIGCGKSTVAELFAACGAGIVDTDIIARVLTGIEGQAMTAIRAAFGPDFVCADGSLDRPRMRRHVFSDAAARQQLEKLLHPLIREEARRQLTQLSSAHPYNMLVVPLLARSQDFRKLSQRILVVDCAPSTQLARITQRDGLSEIEANAIIAAQTPRDAQLALADDIIRNDGPPAALAAEVHLLDQQYRQMNH